MVAGLMREQLDVVAAAERLGLWHRPAVRIPGPMVLVGGVAGFV